MRMLLPLWVLLTLVAATPDQPARPDATTATRTPAERQLDESTWAQSRAFAQQIHDPQCRRAAEARLPARQLFDHVVDTCANAYCPRLPEPRPVICRRG